jgi:hypothetical protein
VANTAGALQIAGTLSSSFAEYQQGLARRAVSETNERLAELQAKDARRRGAADVARSRTDFKKFLGKQRASLAAQGIDIGSGSAQDIQEETQVMSELDALTIKTNAAREAFGIEAAGEAEGVSGELAEKEGTTGAISTLLTGGLKAAGLFQNNKKTSSIDKLFSQATK